MRGLLRRIIGSDKDKFLATMDKIREYSLASGGEITQPDLMEIFERLRLVRSEVLHAVAPAEKTRVRSRTHLRLAGIRPFARSGPGTLPHQMHLPSGSLSSSHEVRCASAADQGSQKEDGTMVIPLDYAGD